MPLLTTHPKVLWHEMEHSCLYQPTSCSSKLTGSVCFRCKTRTVTCNIPHSSIWLRCQASATSSRECPSPGRGMSPTDLQHLLPQPGSSWVCCSPTQDTSDWMMNGHLASLTSLWETGLGPERHNHLPEGSLAIRSHGIGSWKHHLGFARIRLCASRVIMYKGTQLRGKWALKPSMPCRALEGAPSPNQHNCHTG